MIADSIKMYGDLIVELYDSTGQLKDRRELKNMVVNAGKAFIANRIYTNSSTFVTHMAVGSGTTAVDLLNAALVSENERVALTSASQSNAVVSYTAAYAAGVGTGLLTEAGLFTASSGGTMVSRLTFAAINKTAGDTLNVTWNLTVN